MLSSLSRFHLICQIEWGLSHQPYLANPSQTSPGIYPQDPDDVYTPSQIRVSGRGPSSGSREERTKVDSQRQRGRGLHSGEDGILAFLTERNF